MNKQSNTYIITYSTIMVVLVAAVLTFTAIKLGPVQQLNVEIAKKGDILRSVGLLQIKDGEDKQKAIVAAYEKYIPETFLVNIKGEKVDGNPFKVFINLEREYFKGKPTPESKLPVFVSVDDQGAKKYIFPVLGTGLWGPVWGYVALGNDFNTITGAVFSHASETPGLGAEIATPFFQDKFIGKTIFEGDAFVGIEIVKGADAAANNPHGVDAISGGTITSRAVGTMLSDCLGGYQAYIQSQRQAPVNQPDSIINEVIITENEQ